MAQTFAESFAAARRVSAPLVLVRTPDNIATERAAIESALAIKSDKLPATVLIARWDFARGLTVRAELKDTQPILDAVLQKAGLVQSKSVNATESILALLRAAPVGTIVFFHNPHLVWSNPGFVQAMCNVRDDFKSSLRMLALLVPLGTEAPLEVKNDTILLNDPLPNAERLQQVIEKTTKDNGIKLSPDDVVRARDTVRGMSAFVAENATAMSLSSRGLNWDVLLDQRRAAFEAVKGVTLYMGTETFDDVIGNEGIKADVKRMKTARNRVRVVVVLDEFGKMIAGAQAEHGDNTGTAQRQHGAILRWMSDRKVRGMILFGDPGTGKTMVAKTLAKYLDCICVLVEMDKLMDSKLGASENNLNAVFDLIDAIAGEGGALVMATCNEIVPFSTELRRRFTRGTYYFGKADAATRDATWRHYCKKFGLDPEQPRPADDGWTPSEIAVCCEQAYDYDTTLLEGARNIVPICQQQPEAIAERRRAAHGKLLDAATGLMYQMPGLEPEPVALTESRAIIPEA